MESDFVITPLSPSALTYYKFVYEGFFVENDRVVNKILITPRRNDNRLISGYIYVFENSWDIHSFEVSGKQQMAEYTFKQIFGEVLPGVMLPIRNQLVVKFSILGNHGEINSVSSIKYSDIKASSQNLEKRLEQTSASKKQEERRQKIKSLIEKPNFSNADVVKVKTEMEKFENEKNKEAAGRKVGKYEIIEDFNIVRDSAKTLDNEYWDSIRTIPMLDYEVQSYKRSDSLALVKPQKEEKKKSTFSKIMFGDHISNRSKYLNYSGLININANFNAVDIFNYSTKIQYYERLKNQTAFQIKGEAGYSFGRKQILYDLYLAYQYYPETRATVYVNYANKTVDFNANGGIHRTSNALSSLFFKKNYINFYGKHSLQIGNNIDIAEGLRLLVDVAYQKNKQQHNNTNFSFFQRSKPYRSNDPVNPYIEQDSLAIQTSCSFTVNTRLSYTPYQYYVMRGRIKRIVRSEYPTFTLGYKTGISGVFNSASNYDLLTFEVSQNKEFDIFNKISYSAKVGKFLTNRRMHFSEYAHFNLYEDDLMFSPFDGLQKMMQTYYSSTNQWFAQVNFTYTTSRLFIKRFIFERNFMNENLYFSYLRTPHLKHFSEIGYGLSNVFRIFGGGIFLGFEDMQYKFIRLKLSVDFGE
jgi:hypothetical protein